MHKQRIEQIKLLIKEGYMTRRGKIGLSAVGELVYNDLLQAANSVLAQQDVISVTNTQYVHEYALPVRRSVATPA